MLSFKKIAVISILILCLVGCKNKEKEVEVLEVISEEDYTFQSDDEANIINYDEDKPSINGPNTVPFVKGPTSPPPTY